MQNESHALFLDGIRALIVDNDVKFLRSATLMLSLLNFRVATCMTPASALKLLSGKLKSADVVFIDALRATTCSFDFRGVIETDLRIPVIYLFSLDYKVAGDKADDLRRTVCAGTYVIKKPLDADDLSRLCSVIRWHKVLLQTGQNQWAGGGNQVLSATVKALLGCSTVEDQEEDDGRRHFKVVIKGKGRKKRNYTCNHCHDGGSSSSSDFEGGQQPTRRLERMSVTEGQEREDNMAAAYQQQKQRGVKAAKKDDDGSKFQHQPQAMDVQVPVQNQQHRFLFVQPVPRMLNLPPNNPLISPVVAVPSSSNVTAFAGANNTAAPAWLPVYQAPAPKLPVLHQHQQPTALFDSGSIAPPVVVPTMVATVRDKPQFTLNQQQQEQDVHPQPLDAGAFKNAAMAYLQPLNLGAQPDDHDVLAAIMDMFPAGSDPPVVPQHVGVGVASNEAAIAAHEEAVEDAFNSDDYINYSDEAIMPPQNVGQGMAGNEAATMQVLLNSDNCNNNNNAGSSMEMNVNGGNNASFVAPQDFAGPTIGNQMESGAPHIYALTSGSQGFSTMFNGNVDMSAMFSPDRYDENTMFSLDDLLDLDKVSMYPQGQQVAIDTATTAATSADGAGTLLNGGRNVLGPSWKVGASDDDLDILDKFLMDDNDVDFVFPQDMNNGH